MKYLCYILCIFLTACSQANFKDTELLYRVEFRNISEDQITEYRFFKNGLVNETIIHSTSHNADLFHSKFITLDPEQKILAIDLQKQLQELDYHNHFPWKEEFYKRGNVVKIEFPDLIKPKFINEATEAQEILINKTYYYYDGETESAEVFKDLVKLIDIIKITPGVNPAS